MHIICIAVCMGGTYVRKSHLELVLQLGGDCI